MSDEEVPGYPDLLYETTDGFDYTQTAFDFIEGVLFAEPAIARECGDTALMVHLAKNNVSLLRLLLENHVVFPRDSLMEKLGRGEDSVPYNSECARLLVDVGGRPPSDWLLNAMLENDGDAAEWLDAAGARLDACERAVFQDSEFNVPTGKVAKCYGRYTPKDDDYARYLICKWYKVDIAELRGIGFFHFHGIFLDDDEYYKDVRLDERKRLEAEFGFELYGATFNRACVEWRRSASTKDSIRMAAAEDIRRRAHTSDIDPARLPDGRIDAFSIMRANAIYSSRCHVENDRQATEYIEEFEEHFMDRYSFDESDEGWRIRDLVCYLMDDSCGHHDTLRLEMLQCFIRENCIDVNAFVGIYGFHYRTVNQRMLIDCFFDRDWVPNDGWIEDEYVHAPATMLDIAIYNNWNHAAEMLLRAGGRVESCLTWTRIRLQDRWLSTATDLITSNVSNNVCQAWKKLRRLVFKLGKIFMFIRHLYVQLFVPEGSAVKRAKILFDINKAK